MVARTILTQRQDAAMDRIEAHAKSISKEHPDVAEAAERVRDVRGPDEAHTRVFRIEAIADLLETIDEGEATESEAADPLEVKTVPVLREMARGEGVEGSVSQMNKPDLIDAINERRSQEEDEQA
jgi:hypothetical protein